MSKIVSVRIAHQRASDSTSYWCTMLTNSYRRQVGAMAVVGHQNAGSTILTTPIIIAIGTIMITTLIVLAVQILIPYLWYEKLSSTCLKYTYIMEEYGYLTNKEAKTLKSDLEKQGFDTDKMNIKYTNYKMPYGEPIFLRLTYDYELKLPLQNTQTIKMKVERNSVSKR